WLPSPPTDAGSSRATTVLTWPPDGAHGVPPEPELLAIRLDDDREPRVVLRVDETAIEHAQVEEECASIGFDPGWCRRIVLSEPLPKAGTLTLLVDDVAVAEM